MSASGIGGISRYDYWKCMAPYEPGFEDDEDEDFDEDEDEDFDEEDE